MADEYLLASGLINQDGTASFDVFYRQAQTDPLDNPPVGTAYCLELYDAGNTKLSGQCFDVSYDFGDSTMPMTTAPFALTVPFPPTANKIVLTARRCDRRRADGQHPQPAGDCGPTVGGAVKTIDWLAEDGDGDVLSYSVLYSADNKQTWFAVATDLTAATYCLDTSTLPGGTNAFVRILASDGINTGQGDAGPFVVAGKEPTALIDPLPMAQPTRRARPCCWWAMASTWRMARCPIAVWFGRRTGMASWAPVGPWSGLISAKGCTPSP